MANNDAVDAGDVGVGRDEQAEQRVERRNAAMEERSEHFEKIDRRHLTFFCANSTLATWARLHSAEFVSYGEAFFAVWEKTSCFEHHFEMAGFSEALLGAWSRVDLDEACRRRERGAGRGSYGSGTQVWVEGVIPSDRFQLLDESVGNENSARLWRMKVLEGAETDREILQCVQAAMLRGSINWIRDIARTHYGTSSLAKERALAVTLLAFAGEAEDDQLLSQWIESDAFRWVRGHAEWAQRVRRQVRTAETRWGELRELAEQPDDRLEIVANKLTALSPILPPTALAWPKVISPVPRVAALLRAFWYNWQNGGGAKGERELCQRKPHEFCRGERVNDVTKRMSPWWRL